MTYRVGIEADWPKITKFLADTTYYAGVDAAKLGGHWFVAEKDDKIYGVLWFFGEAPNVYMDYYAASNSLVAVKLLARAEQAFKGMGVRYVRGVIERKNINMRRLAFRFGAKSTEGFTYVSKEI